MESVNLLVGLVDFSWVWSSGCCYKAPLLFSGSILSKHLSLMIPLVFCVRKGRSGPLRLHSVQWVGDARYLLAVFSFPHEESHRPKRLSCHWTIAHWGWGTSPGKVNLFFLWYFCSWIFAPVIWNLSSGL